MKFCKLGRDFFFFRLLWWSVAVAVCRVNERDLRRFAVCRYCSANCFIWLHTDLSLPPPKFLLSSVSWRFLY
ncbi:hypothetical protein S83_002169 [Arachis hypogaea]